MERVLFEVGNSSSTAGPTNFGIQKVSGTTSLNPMANSYLRIFCVL